MKGGARANLRTGSGLFWLLFPLTACITAGLLYFWCERRIENYDGHLFSILHTRADNTLWAVENAVLLFNAESPEKISRLLAQMARQPGVAWLAIVSENGLILADSNPSLAGGRLYTPREMAALNPQPHIQGRFTPDEPEIFEVWKLLKPLKNEAPGTTLFAAFNFSSHAALLKEFSSQLRLRVFLTAFSVFSIAALLYLAWQFKKSGKNLEEARAVALQVARNFPDGLLVTDARGNITAFNENFLKLLGQANANPVALKNLPGKNWHDLQEESGGSNFPENREITLPDGRALLVRTSEIFSCKGKLSGFLFIARDKTVLEKARTREAEQAKFAALGKVMAGIAHEIRNPLGAMCGYASWLSERLAADAEGKKAADLLLHEGERLNNALSEMLTLTRAPRLRKSAVTPKELLSKLALLAQPDAAAKNIRIKTAFNPPELANSTVFLDRDRMLQAFLNILLNGIQASPKNSEVILGANLENIPSGNAVCFSFRDFGEGLPQAVLAEMFTPYFTTKAAGTGLGLPLAKNIVDSHGGAIEGGNAENGGAIFKIILPLESHDQKTP